MESRTIFQLFNCHVHIGTDAVRGIPELPSPYGTFISLFCALFTESFPRQNGVKINFESDDRFIHVWVINQARTSF